MENQQAVTQNGVKIQPIKVGKKLHDTNEVKSYIINDVVNTTLKKGDCCK
jgi:hypothetical protein